jgi:hypothetical protein
VRDRLAAFYHWNDRSSLTVALKVAGSGEIDLKLIRAWSVNERSIDKYEEFIRQLTRMKRKRRDE